MGAGMEAAVNRPGVLGTLPAGWDAPAAGSVALGPVPAGLTLPRVARSHGWCDLAPYAYDRDAGVLHRWLDGVGAVRLDGSWTASWGAGPGRGPGAGVGRGEVDAAAVRATLRWCLGLDDDRRGAPAVARATRVLRAPTVWEDLGKVLAETNTSWASARRTAQRMSAAAGGGWPGPQAFLGLEVAELGLGYRAAALVELAERVLGGLDVEAWRGLSDDEVVAAVRELRGFGAMSAATMLGLLGRPRRIAVDRWAAARLGEPAGAVAARAAAAGRWGGEVVWGEITASWL